MGHQPILDLRCKARNRLTCADSFSLPNHVSFQHTSRLDTGVAKMIRFFSKDNNTNLKPFYKVEFSSLVQENKDLQVKMMHSPSR